MKKNDSEIRKHIASSGQSLSAVGRVLGVSSSELLNWWSGKASLPEHANIKAMKSAMNLEAAKKKFTFEALPERYRTFAYSSVASSRHILEIIKLQYGVKVLDGILQELGVHEVYFQDIENKISVKFFEDILECYARLGNSDKEIMALSRGLFLSVQGSDLTEDFCSTGSYEEAYSQIASSTADFETNFDYKFFISKNGLDVYAKPSEQLAEATKNKTYGSHLLYKYRSHLFGNMPILNGLSPLPIRVQSCISRGQNICHYSARFADAFKLTPSFSLV